MSLLRTLLFHALTLVCLGFIAGCSGSPKGNGTAAGDKGSAAANGQAELDPRCVVPSPESIETGKYVPLARPLFVYVNKKSLARPEVAGYLRYYLNEGQALVGEIGYIRLAAPALKESQDLLAASAGEGKSPGKPSGRVVIDGSSTVFPISQAVAEEFQKQYPGAQVEVGRSGTGGGFKKFCVGETDINGASRPIDDKEVEKCKEKKIEYVALRVAVDGLSIVVNPANDWCRCLRVEQLQALWEPNSKLSKWSDLNPQWPAEEIRLYGADTDSGTFDFFTEVIVGKTKSSRDDYTASGDDNVLVQGVTGDRNSLGYIPFAYYLENKGKLKVLGIIPREK